MNQLFFRPLLVALSFSFLCHASTNHLEEPDCTTIYNELAQKYLDANPELLSIYEDKAHLSQVTINPTSFSFVESFDLDQGSWNLRREAIFIDGFGNRLELYTMGDLYCSDERILGIKSLIPST
jgi:hypothetical protein